MDRLSLKHLLQDLYRQLKDDGVRNGAASLGFFFTLAIFPALILLMSVLPFLPIDRVDEALLNLLRQALPSDASQLLARVVSQAAEEPRGGALSFGVLGTLWAASRGMYALMQQLNTTYDVKESRGFVRARIVALLLSIVFILLVIGAFSLIVVGGMIQDWLAAKWSFGSGWLNIFTMLRWVIIVAALLLGLALIYRFAPNAEQRFRFVTPGSVAGALLLILTSAGLAVYTENFPDYDIAYGGIGAVIILMLWFYIAGLVILVGSEINKLIERNTRRGKDKGATPTRDSDESRTESR